MDFAHVEKLHAALRRLAPQINAVLCDNEDTDERHLEVAYNGSGTRTVDWDGSQYRWTSGPHQGTPLATDPEDAAASLAETLGAPLPELPPRRSRPISPGGGLTI